jgi:hypothetical protein
MAKLNWARQRQRKAIQRHGTEDVLATLQCFAPLSRPRLKPRPLSKAELRAQTAAATTAYAGPVTKLPTVMTLRCMCGHVAKVTVPLDVARPRFRCSRCGTRQ